MASSSRKSSPPSVIGILLVSQMPLNHPESLPREGTKTPRRSHLILSSVQGDFCIAERHPVLCFQTPPFQDGPATPSYSCSGSPILDRHDDEKAHEDCRDDTSSLGPLSPSRSIGLSRPLLLWRPLSHASLEILMNSRVVLCAVALCCVWWWINVPVTYHVCRRWYGGRWHNHWRRGQR